MNKAAASSILIAAILLAVAVIAEAQQPKKVPRIGVLRPERPGDAGGQALIDAFRQGLRELGYVEGKSIALEIRWSEGKRDRYSEFATELVRLKVAVIL